MMQWGSLYKLSPTYNDEPTLPRPSEWSGYGPSLWSKAESSYSSLKKSDRLTKQEDFHNGNQRHLEPDHHEPDNRLANWKRWLNIHKDQQDKLSNILKRPPQCLLMNMNYNSLYVNQQKQLITEASRYEFCDKYRGHPCFWSTDFGADGDKKKLGIYQPIQKRYDRSRPTAQMNWCPKPSELEYVGVPDVIMAEKGLSGEQCLPPPKDNWDLSYYVYKKKVNLKEKLDLFQEHAPESEELALIGSKLVQPDESRVTDYDLEMPQEESSVDDFDVSPAASENYEQSIGETISVEIDGEILDSTLKVWIVYFEDCLTNKFYEKSLTIKNLNDCCLRYSWESVLPTFLRSFLPLKKIKYQKPFYFNKNDAVILPNSSVKLSFYFESAKAGVFCEKFILHLSNKPDEEEYVTVELHSVVEERSDTEENLKVIDSYIEACARYTIASKTVNEILERNRPERAKTLPYDWMFFEEQIFLFNNPDLFYDNKYVSSLKEMYKKNSEGPWDFSVQTLRKKLLEKALLEDMAETVNEFTATVCQLMKPKSKYSFTNEKMKTVYELMCCFIDNMEKESDSLKCILKIPLKISTSMDIVSEEVLTKTSRASKLMAKESITSKKSRKKHSQKKIKFSDEKTSSSGQEESSLLRQSLTIGDSSSAVLDDTEEILKKQEYLEALYIKTYHHLCITVDNIAAVIDSFDAQKQKSALLSLKTNDLHNNFK